MILLIFSTNLEANPTIEALEASPTSDPQLHSFDLGYILITGIGMPATNYHLGRLLPNDIKEIWSYGIAGSLSDSLEVGSFVDVQKIDKLIVLPPSCDEHSSHLAKCCHPTISLEKGTAALISSDFPIHQRTTKDLLSQTWDLVDMEGYAIAYTAQRYQIPYLIRKIISDMCEEGGPEKIQEMFPPLSKKIAEEIKEKITALRSAAKTKQIKS